MKQLAFIFIILLCASSVFGKTYYVDSKEGDDSYEGISQDRPFKTLTKISKMSFNPGDSILLKRNSVWNESLIATSSGSSVNPITYGAYGDGSNPLIKLTEECTKWSLITLGSKKIWMGTTQRAKTPLGAMRGGKIVPDYHLWTMSLDDIENGYFWRANEEWNFYFRWDEGNPGLMEIGVVDYGIFINEKSYIVIDGIDVYGPCSLGGVRQVTVYNSNNIIIKNCVLANHNNGGVIVKYNCYDCSLINIECYGHKDTGLYFWRTGTGNKMIDCNVHDCGIVPNHIGDKGLIGVFDTSGAIIQNCKVSTNGYKGLEACDAAISFVEAPYGKVIGCFVKNAADRGIMFAGNCNDGVIAYNVIDSWGYLAETNVGRVVADGLRLGGAGSHSDMRNCKVYNNLFINSRVSSGDYAAIRIIYRPNEGLEVKNNIFYNNAGIYEIYAESEDNFKNWDFSNNLYYRKSGNVIKIKNEVYDFQHIIGNAIGYFSYDFNLEKNSLIADPLLTSNLMGIRSTSPCRGAGTYVGFSYDIYGNVINENNVDIGPFQYTESIQPPQGMKVE